LSEIASGGYGDIAMETVEFEIEMDNDLIHKARKLAIRYFGDDTDASLARVIELAVRIRCLWSGSVEKGRDDTEEAVSQWEFHQSLGISENGDSINEWLFRR
jgi:hypothetical protein